jgi:PAS domain S-box-containing protein
MVTSLGQKPNETASKAIQIISRMVETSAKTHADDDAIIGMLIDQLRNYFDVDYATICRPTKDACLADRVSGKPKGAHAGGLQRRGLCPCLDLGPERPSLLLHSLNRSEYRGHKIHVERGVNCYAGIRLETDGQFFGTLGLFATQSRNEDFSADDKSVLQTAAVLISQRLTYRSSIEHNRLVTINSNIGVWEWDMRSDTIYWSKRYLEIFGIDDPGYQPTIEDFERRIHPDDLPICLEAARQHLEGREPFSVGYRIRHTNGSWVHIQAGGQATWDENGEPIRMDGSIEDVTDKKLAEAEAALALQRYQLAILGSQAGVWDWDLVEQTLYWSPRMLEIFGIEDAAFELTMETFKDRLHPDDRDRVIGAIEEHLIERTVYQITMRMRHEDGHYVPIIVGGQAIWDADGTPVRMAGSMHDITDQAVAEEAARVAEERYRLAISGASAGIWDWNPITGELFWSRQLTKTMGLEGLDYVPSFDDWKERIHPDDRDAVVATLTQHLDQQGEYDVEYRTLNGAGDYIWVHTCGQAIWNDAGEPQRMAGSLYDVTDRKQAVQQALDRASMLEFAGRVAKIGYVEWDLETNEAQWGDQVYEIYKLDRSSSPPDFQDMMDMTHRDDQELVARHIKAARETGAPQAFVRRVIRGDGVECIVQSWLECLRDSEGRPTRILGAFQDVTELRQAEVTLRFQSEELIRANAELERFAAIAAHDLQEPLRKVSGFGELLVKKYSDRLDESGQKIVETMVDGARRMRTLVQDLLRYSSTSSEEMERQDVDLTQVLGDVRECLQSDLDDNHAVLEVENMPVISGDAALLRQVFHNLICNAIKYRGDTNPHIKIGAERSADGDAWHIRVEDNGIGFDAEHADRIFEIFQRLHTRDDYEGTGVGLALCHRVIERHGGRIWAEGVVGKGACFHVMLGDRGDHQIDRHGGSGAKVTHVN